MSHYQSSLPDNGSIPRGPQVGNVITARAFADGRLFKVRLLSSDVVARGGSASVVKGEIMIQHGRRLGQKPAQAQAQAVQVALKMFNTALRHEEQQLYEKLYSKELNAAKRLGGPNSLNAGRYVLPFIGVADLYSQHILISPFMRNGNLLEFIKRQAPEAGVRQSMLRRVAEAVAYLHDEAGLVHGDLKCENILISDENRPLLADFGLSALVEQEQGNVTLTGIRQLNTVRFAAPELLDDLAVSGGCVRSKTRESDVWAFGMVIVQVFTGDHPWPDTPSLTVAPRILTSSESPYPHPGATAEAHGLTDSWWDICLKCWEYEACKRPPMRAVSAELEMSYKISQRDVQPVEELSIATGRAMMLMDEVALKTRSWGSVLATLMKTPLLEPWPCRDVDKAELLITPDTIYKGQYDPDELPKWLSSLVDDENTEILAAAGDPPLVDIVTHANEAVESLMNIEWQARSFYEGIFVRYPDPKHPCEEPFITVYHIVFRGHYHYIVGQFISRSFKLRESATSTIPDKAKRRAITFLENKLASMKSVPSGYIAGRNGSA